MQPTATAALRFKHIQFTHILLPYVLKIIQQAYPRKSHPLALIKVSFSENGEPFGATIRLSGDTLGFVDFTEYKFHEKVILVEKEVQDYLIQVCKEAQRIVQPIVVKH